MVSAVVAGGHSSAFLTSAPDEFPEPRGSQLLDRYITSPPHSTQLQHGLDSCRTAVCAAQAGMCDHGFLVRTRNSFPTAGRDCASAG